MSNPNPLNLRYAKIVAQLELLASALAASGNSKLKAKDQKVFLQLEEDFDKVDLCELTENKIQLLEDCLALLGANQSFYGEEESAIVTYASYLLREVVLKNKTLNPAVHKKQLADISLLGARQADERRLKEIDLRITTLKKNPPAPSSYQYKSYQQSLAALEKEKQDLAARLFKI